MSDDAHPKCQGEAGHICQQPSGRTCVDCDQPAGTLWGPMWCPGCDEKRLNRVSASLEAALASLRTSPAVVRSDRHQERGAK
jgi:Zn finger protein HypA/HybF involved in hydrogenase expression